MIQQIITVCPHNLTNKNHACFYESESRVGLRACQVELSSSLLRSDSIYADSMKSDFSLKKINQRTGGPKKKKKKKVASPDSVHAQSLYAQSLPWRIREKYFYFSQKITSFQRIIFTDNLKQEEEMYQSGYEVIQMETVYF